MKLSSSAAAALILLQLLSDYSSVQAQTPATICPIECQYDTTCRLGSVNVTGLPIDPVTNEVILHPELDDEGWICECPRGLAGVRCGRKYESCNADQSQGCYHGGSCLDGLTDQYGHEQFFCDCNFAIEASREEPGQPVGAERYVGRYCEHPVTPTDECDNDFNKYCVNGGSCRTAGDLELEPCDCPDGFTGKYCEYDVTRVPECNLDCGEHGICRLGAKQQTPFEAKLNIAPHSSFMHCECREGYLGFSCDVEATICGDVGNHWCFNGGECKAITVQDGQEPSWECDCSQADVLSTGAACEQRASNVCPNSTIAPPEGSQHIGFCVNGGICQVARGTGERYCDCPSTLPSGPHCESEAIHLGEQSPITRVTPTAAPTAAPTTTPSASPVNSPQVDTGVVVDDKPEPTASPVKPAATPDNRATPPLVQAPSEDSAPLGAIIGGAISALVLIVVAIFLVKKKRRTTSRNAGGSLPNTWDAPRATTRRPISELRLNSSSMEEIDFSGGNNNSTHNNASSQPSPILLAPVAATPAAPPVTDVPLADPPMVSVPLSDSPPVVNTPAIDAPVLVNNNDNIDLFEDAVQNAPGDFAAVPSPISAAVPTRSPDFDQSPPQINNDPPASIEPEQVVDVENFGDPNEMIIDDSQPELNEII